MNTKISQDAASAFENNKNFSRGNTRVFKNPFGGMDMYLHGNLIASTYKGKLSIQTSGFPTQTTKARLNALKGVHIVQENFQCFLNGKKWNGWPCNPLKLSTIKAK